MSTGPGAASPPDGGTDAGASKQPANDDNAPAAAADGAAAGGGGDGADTEARRESDVSQTSDLPPLKQPGRSSLADMQDILGNLNSLINLTPTTDDSTTFGGEAGNMAHHLPPSSSPPGGRRRTLATTGRASRRFSRTGSLNAGGSGPKEYAEEKYLKPEVKRARERLAGRFETLGFPRDGCLQSIKEAGGNLDQSVKLLLFYYPKGEGTRKMVRGLLKLIKEVEKKLEMALDSIRKTMSGGTPEERLKAVRVHFDNCDEGNKEYLTPNEFRRLSSTLGVEMSDQELAEAILEIDEDGNGQIEVDEYLMWWGDRELLDLYNEQNPGSGSDDDDGDDDDDDGDGDGDGDGGEAAQGDDAAAAGSGEGSGPETVNTGGTPPAGEAGAAAGLVVPALMMPPGTSASTASAPVQSARSSGEDGSSIGAVKSGSASTLSPSRMVAARKRAMKRASLSRRAPNWAHVLDSQNPMSAGLAGMPAGGYRGGRPAHIPRRRTLSATQWMQVNNLQLNKEKLPEIGRKIDKHIEDYQRRTSIIDGATITALTSKSANSTPTAVAAAGTTPPATAPAATTAAAAAAAAAGGTRPNGHERSDTI